VSGADTPDTQTITALAQDARGLLWIGTISGLFRYDGYRLRKFSHNTNDPFSLAGDYVGCLWAAPNGRVWVGTFNDGLLVFDPTTERFERFHHAAKKADSLVDGRISAITGGDRDEVWIATDQGLYNPPASGKRFNHFKHGSGRASLMDDKVRSLLRDKKGDLWVGSASGLQRLRNGSQYFETIVTEKSVQTLFLAQDGKLWLGTSNHGAAWLIPGPTERGPLNVHWLSSPQIIHPWIMGIAQPQPTQIWLTTNGGGIYVLDASDGHLLQNLRHDATLPNSLALDVAKPILHDAGGWLWVGTWGGGLQRINTKNNGMYAYFGTVQSKQKA
jgi:ligand-binding sensor domain-containing protein